MSEDGRTRIRCRRIVFLRRGEAKGERLSGDDIERPELKARVEAMLGVVRPPPTPVAVK